MPLRTILLLAALCACQPHPAPQSPVPPPVIVQPAPVVEQPPAFTLQSMDRSPLRSVALWAPPPGTPGRYETMVLLHGMQAKPPDPNWMVTLHYQPAFANRILIAPALPKPRSDWGDPANVKAIAEVVRDVAAKYPVDPDALYLVGYSAGASRVLNVAWKLPGKLAGVAAFAGDVARPWRSPGAPKEVPASRVLLVCMTEDRAANASCAVNERNRRLLEGRGVAEVSLQKVVGDHQLNFDHVAGVLDAWMEHR